MQAVFHHGHSLMVDYTPGSAVAAGDVVVIGDKPYVAHRDLPANELGALAAGGGVYKGVAAGNYAPGEAVYWNDTANKFTQAVGGHPHFGYIVPNSNPAADGDVVYVEHAPNGSATAAE
jgi:predicted RecA/RadA family phage recombinase